MRNLIQRWFKLGIGLMLLCAARLAYADTLTWHTNDNRVSADIQSVPLYRLLEGVAKLTGWQVYVESNTVFTVSAKFKDLKSGDALRHLLGDLNYALVPQTNAPPRLYVFHSSQENATQLIHPADLNSPDGSRAKKIPNELILRLKPGANIDELAKLLGAKVTGRIGDNIYRLQFTDEAAADAARGKLSDNSDVAGVDSNYIIDAPPPVMRLDSGVGGPPVQLKLNPPDSSGHVVVGLIDTAVQPLGNSLDSFVTKSISVAGDYKPDPGDPTHGTAMLQNILRAASSAEGGSSSMQVISVDVYGSNPTTSTFNVAAGVVQAVNNGANIINLSLGSPGDTQFFHDLIQQVTQKGIPVFAAAGNDASPELYYPAAYPEVTAVTAASSPGKLASYANYGPFVDLMDLGSGVIDFGDSRFLVSGTSTATAYISGLTAGLADKNHANVSAAANAVLNNPGLQFKPPK
jgi:hypothetical protein